MNLKNKKIIVFIIGITIALIGFIMIENKYYVKTDLSNLTNYSSSDNNKLLRANIVKKGILPTDRTILYYDLLVNNETDFSLDKSQKIAYQISSKALEDYKITDVKYHVYTSKDEYKNSFTEFGSYLDEFNADLKKDNNTGIFSRALTNGDITDDISNEELARKKDSLVTYMPLYKVYKVDKNKTSLDLELYTEPSYNSNINNYGANNFYFLSKDILDYNNLDLDVNIKMYIATLDDTNPIETKYEDCNYWSYSLSSPTKINYNSKLIISSNMLNTTGENNEINNMSQEELEKILPDNNETENK